LNKWGIWIDEGVWIGGCSWNGWGILTGGGIWIGRRILIDYNTAHRLNQPDSFWVSLYGRHYINIIMTVKTLWVRL